jgi:hypothetical protein
MNHTAHTLPSFLIVGCPKSGTTSLYEYFRLHPDVFMPERKEVHYFSSDFESNPKVTSPEEYQALFQNASPNQRTGIVPIYYVYSEDALENLLKYNPDAKIILSLRNPADLIQAWHWQMLETLDEDQTDFETAWKLIEPRQKGQNLPTHCRNPKILNYRLFGQLDTHVERLQKSIPQEQLKIILLDDLKNVPDQTLHNLCQFLDIPWHPDMKLPYSNPASQLRHRKLMGLLKKPPLPLRIIRDALKPFYNKLGFHPGKWFFEASRTPQKRPPLRPEFEKQLKAEFLPVVNRLEELLNRNLETWKT